MRLDLVLGLLVSSVRQKECRLRVAGRLKRWYSGSVLVLVPLKMWKEGLRKGKAKLVM
jgi:hypothetical protein